MENYSFNLYARGYSEVLLKLIIYDGREFGFLLSDLCNVIQISTSDLNKSIERQLFGAATYGLQRFELPNLRKRQYEYYISKDKRTCLEDDKYWINLNSIFSLQQILLDAIGYQDISLDQNSAVLLGMSCEDLIRAANYFTKATAKNNK